MMILLDQLFMWTVTVVVTVILTRRWRKLCDDILKRNEELVDLTVQLLLENKNLRDRLNSEGEEWKNQ